MPHHTHAHTCLATWRDAIGPPHTHMSPYTHTHKPHHIHTRHMPHHTHTHTHTNAPHSYTHTSHFLHMPSDTIHMSHDTDTHMTRHTQTHTPHHLHACHQTPTTTHPDPPLKKIFIQTKPLLQYSHTYALPHTYTHISHHIHACYHTPPAPSSNKPTPKHSNTQSLNPYPNKSQTQTTPQIQFSGTCSISLSQIICSLLCWASSSAPSLADAE